MSNNAGISYGLSFPNGDPTRFQSSSHHKPIEPHSESSSEDHDINKKKNSRQKKRKLTEKELEERRRLMETDALDLNHLRSERIQQSLLKEKEEEEHKIKEETPNFLKETNKQAYLSDESMSDRLKRNVFYRQRN